MERSAFHGSNPPKAIGSLFHSNVLRSPVHVNWTGNAHTVASAVAIATAAEGAEVPVPLLCRSAHAQVWLYCSSDVVIMKYTVVLQRTEEGFSVGCPGLPGCWSQGA